MNTRRAAAKKAPSEKRASRAAKHSKRAPRGRGRGSSDAVRVRMYNVGFGDCFLLKFPTTEGTRNVLIDCGYHTQGRGEFSDRTLVEQIKADLLGETLHVLVATHRHQDHISGFGEKDLWRDVDVGEVWLPFTARREVARDNPALAAWEAALGLVPNLVGIDGNLAAHVRATLPPDDDVPGITDERSASAADIAFMLWNARQNAPAVEMLRSGFRRSNGAKSVRRYLPESGRDVPTQFECDMLPGVRVHVLGPSRDPRYRGKRKAPDAWGLLPLAAMPGAAGAADSAPFGPQWRISPESLNGRLPFQRKSLAAIRSFSDGLGEAALALDEFLNGESLVLLFELGRAKLLFTGDAEVSSWMKIVESADAIELVSEATFLKIGHHGSHNATPMVVAREHLARGTRAMISTQQGTERYRNGIPMPELLQTLAKAGVDVARSDRSRDASSTRFTVDKKARWIDCLVRV